jgi:hypothetical protein
MNPLASLKWVSRWSATVTVAGILLLAAGCGSNGGLPPIPGGNFTNASLNGQYLISQTGVGVNQSGTGVDPFSESIVFTADGSGKLTVTVDDFSQSGTLFEDTNLPGTYSISKDGTGNLQVNFPGVLVNYAITMTDDSHFYVIQQNTFATASGYGEKQDTTAFAAAPSGNFVFKAHNLNISSRVGGISIAGGAVSGNEDRLNLGSQSLNQGITGVFSVTPPDTNGRGTFSIADSGGTSNFYYYVVGTGKIRILSNTGSLEVGQAEAQTGGPFSVATLANGNSYVFGSSGDTVVSGSLGIHSAGVFTTDGNGNILPGGAVDYVQDVTVNSNLGVAGGNYMLDPDGRGTLNLTLNGGVIGQQIFWMVNPTNAYFLVNSTAAVEDGRFTVQVPPPLNVAAPQAAFVMDGFDVAYKDRVGAFGPLNGSNFRWNQAANSFDPTTGLGTLTTLGTNGIYQTSSNGRATVTVNGVTSSLVFYFSSNGSGFMVQEDADIGGEFTAQASQ